MKDYYEHRAPEYDEWYEGAGLFAARSRPGFAEELRTITGLLASLPPARVLDVACGTGYLTRHLRGYVVALDQSPGMLRRARVQAPEARLVCGDALALPFAARRFDRLMAAHIYGHVEAGDREAFLTEARAVAAELLFVDAGARGGEPREEWQERVLSDGTRFRVYKRFFTGDGLASEIGDGRVLHDGYWFVVVAAPGGDAARAPAHQDGFGD
jgi:demethylmenaquinone methyltransferase/2-methoxy-6-polyprenyl-1,4-benzoquinol methylase